MKNLAFSFFFKILSGFGILFIYLFIYLFLRGKGGPDRLIQICKRVLVRPIRVRVRVRVRVSARPTATVTVRVGGSAAQFT